LSAAKRDNVWRNLCFAIGGIALVGWVLAASYKGKWEAAQRRAPTKVEVHDTLKTRPDTIEVAPPALIAKINSLGGRLAAFLTDTAHNPDTCFALLTQAVVAWDSLKRALAMPPAIRLALADSGLPYLRAAVRYHAERGDTFGQADWAYEQIWARWPLPPGYVAPGLQKVFGFAVGFDGKDPLAGLRLRLGKNLIVGANRNLDKKTWGGEASWFVF
jgi:hypothetical protein